RIAAPAKLTIVLLGQDAQLFRQGYGVRVAPPLARLLGRGLQGLPAGANRLSQLPSASLPASHSKAIVGDERPLGCFSLFAAPAGGRESTRRAAENAPEPPPPVPG